MPEVIRVETVYNIVKERVCPEICPHAVCRELLSLNREISRQSKKFGVQVITNGLIEDYQKTAVRKEQERIINLIRITCEYENIPIPRDLIELIRSEDEQA